MKKQILKGLVIVVCLSGATFFSTPQQASAAAPKITQKQKNCVNGQLGGMLAGALGGPGGVVLGGIGGAIAGGCFN
ncbi:hypothetical protein CKN86_13375 [Carnobacterium divergens]|uniref:Divergicin A n=1 Tax=Carnobacterium divergens TaxID=2748 RepID=Q3SAX6_CARDV|nr:hypothetical protein [Carnobacterium divergens]AAZ29031.1 divergicin A precursor [Carnobacterium divergens]MCO6019400.1 hypothetical protein [Carnobacterium divergens]TFI60413.1 hypothetical protein CKN62_13560 [Carnobacterium divergens]TFI86631.1 hypothetical protein CKN61_13130 [Carnobacterium divergens]TFI86736.1 hypothetical protein CKN84_13840 [Carnobacterium divergens]